MCLKRTLRVFGIFLFGFNAVLVADEPKPDVSPVLSQRGELIFADDFEAEQIRTEWVALHGTRWSVVDGTLKGEPSPQEYRQKQIAKGNKRHSGGTPSSRLVVPVDDCILQFRFRLTEGLKGAHFGFNDGTFKTGTGHVCRFTVSTNHGLSLQKDRNAKLEQDVDEVLATSSHNLQADKWYWMMLEVVGGQMAAQVSGSPVLKASHPRIDIRKDQINLPTRGGGVILYDNVRVWKALPRVEKKERQEEDEVEKEKRPDVVVIMADDMGYSDLGCFGGEIRTPNLDRLADSGLRYTNFYSENMCWVSRAALLTGIYHKTSMINNSIHPKCVTLPEALLASGYQTRMSGKWHLAGKPYRIFPNDRGYEEFYGILGGASSFFAPAFLTRNRKNVETEAYQDPEYYLTDAISREAARMIRAAHDKQPLFLSVAYTAAHWPLHAKQADIKEYQGEYAMGWDKLRERRLAKMKELGIVKANVSLSVRHSKVPAWDKETNQAWQQRRMEVYAAQVTSMDRGVGEIVRALKETGRLENTLILFTVDNGGCHVEYHPDRKGDFLPIKTRDGRLMRPGNIPQIMPGPEETYQSYGFGWANLSNTPYRQFKQFDHEGGVRTPMIACWPNGISAQGRLVESVAHLIDLMPTVLEVTKTKIPATIQSGVPIPMDGQSIADSFSGKEVSAQRTLFFHHAKGRALRHGSWKLVSLSKKKWELYNLADDPVEEDNLADRLPEKVKELAAIWQSESQRLVKQAN